MLVEDRRGTARGARVWLAALAAVAVLAIAGAGSVSAVRGQSSLTGPGVTPREGTVATTIAFTVVYQNDKGSPAVRVWVTVGGTSQDMTAQPGGDWKKGTTFRWAGKLPVGSKTVLFQALGKDHSQASIAGGNVTITLVPKPTPTPTPTPKPTPTPTPKPRATPVPTPRPTLRPAPRTTPEPPSAPRPTPRIAPGTRSGPPAPVATPTTTPIPEGRTSEPSDGAFAEATSPPIAVIVGGIAAGGGPGVGPSGPDLGPVVPRPGSTGSGGQDGWGAAAAALSSSGLTGRSTIALGLGATLVVSTGAVTMAMGFGLFGKRRRDGEQTESDEFLAAAAASGLGTVPTDLAALAVAVETRGPGGVVGATDQAGLGPDAVPEPDQDETLLPRWRRPSLLVARKADPIRDNVPAPALTFDAGLVGPLDGRERRVIRYRVVRLLDAPDELRGVEIGYLDQGDEVELVEKYGAYWLVLSPDGQQGWLHKMVLGEAIGDEPPRNNGPIATMPTAPETWTMGDAEDDDHDVFEAYLASRRARES